MNLNYKCFKLIEFEFVEELKLDEYELIVLVEIDLIVVNVGFIEVDDGFVVVLINGYG